MKIFISWSGPRSMAIGQAFRDWLPCVLQYAKPYFTPDDIDKGARWNTEISRELEDSKIGLLCLTHENLTAPWLMFEAGAISKSISLSRLCPILFRVDQVQVTGPLSQFQNTQYSKTEIHKFLKTINGEAGTAALSEAHLDSSFEVWWPKLDENITSILDASSPNHPAARSTLEIAEETLSIVRSLAARDSQQESEDESPHLALIWDMVVEHGTTILENSKKNDNVIHLSILRASLSHMRKFFNLLAPKLEKRLSYPRREASGSTIIKSTELRIAQLEKTHPDDDIPF